MRDPNRATARALSAAAWLMVSLLAALLLLSIGGTQPAVAFPLAKEAAPAATAEPSLAGLTLDEALRKLQARGLQIVFTTQLVRPGMTVATEPAASEPRRILDELLAPHGLVAQEGGGGTLVVVRAAPRARAAEPVAASLVGTVHARESQRPLSGAKVRVLEADLEVQSGAGGDFAIAGLAPGSYTVEARLRGFFDERAGVVVGADGPPAEVALALVPAPYIHDEIVVRPSSLSLLDEEPAAPLSLSRSEIEALPHLGGDLFRALSLLPGTTGNDVSAQFHVHGGRRNEVQILLDGQELYEAFHLQDFDSALSIVAPGSLASAQLSTGAFPAARGDRMSGVLDMTTETPTGPLRTRLSLSLLNAVAASGGTFDGDRGAWMTSARRGSIDLASRIFGREDPVFWDLYGKAQYQLAPQHNLRAHLLRASDQLAFSQTIDGDSKTHNTEYDSTYLWATHQAVIGERLLVETTASGSRIERDRRGTESEEEQSLAVLDRRDFDVAGLAQTWSLQAAPDHALRWGFELRRYETAYDYFNRADRELTLSTPLADPAAGVPRFATTLRGDHGGLWVTDRFSPLSALTLELGLRYDRHTLTDDTLLSPRVNAAWRLGEATVLRAAWGHFFQSQRPYELEIQDGETRFSRAERSEHWVLGYERLFGRGDRGALRALRVEAYRRDIRDPRARFESLFEPINTFPEVEPDRVRIAPERSRAEGIEVVLRGAFGSKLDWWVNYAYSTVEDHVAGRSVRRQVDQPHAVNLQLGYRPAKRWNVLLAWRYHTGWPTTPVFTRRGETAEDEEPVLEVFLGPINSRRLSSYHRLDLRASREWTLRSGRLLLFVDLQNAYNRKNLSGFDFSLDDGELVRRDETWPGIFPSIGVSWEF